MIPPIGRKTYDTFIAGPAPWLSATFVGFDGSDARFEVREFKVSKIPNDYAIDTYSSSCGAGCGGDKSLVRTGYYGQTDHAEALRLLKRAKHSDREIVNLINAEITAHPHDVGPPIDILVVEPTRAYWVPDHHQGCPAIQ